MPSNKATFLRTKSSKIFLKMKPASDVNIQISCSSSLLHTYQTHSVINIEIIFGNFQDIIPHLRCGISMNYPILGPLSSIIQGVPYSLSSCYTLFFVDRARNIGHAVCNYKNKGFSFALCMYQIHTYVHIRICIHMYILFFEIFLISKRCFMNKKKQ